MDISKKIKKDFPWFKNNPKLFYFDSGATSLKPKIMINTIVDYYSSKSCNPHNFDSSFTYALGAEIEDVRKLFANHLNCLSNEIVFTSGATESLNLFASSLKDIIPSSSEINLTTIEHSSNIVPWMNIANSKKIKINWIGKENIISEPEIIKSISKKTSVLSFCSSSNLFGTSLNVSKISKSARKINPKIIIVVDATQTLPHEKINLKKWDVDFIAASGHKMCGPTGVGLAYINKKWANKINPIKYGGGMNNVLTLNKFTYSEVPTKFEGGTPNVAGILGWAAALKYLSNIGWDKIKNHSIELKNYFDKKSQEIPNLENYSKPGKFPVISFNINGIYSQDLANYLWQNKIIVRSGLSCAKNASNVIKTESVVRASLYVYNSFKDIDYLIKVLKNFKKGKELDGII